MTISSLTFSLIDWALTLSWYGLAFRLANDMFKKEDPKLAPAPVRDDAALMKKNGQASDPRPIPK